MLPLKRCLLGCGIVLATALAIPAAEGLAARPMRVGVNMAGSWHMIHTGQFFYDYEAWYDAAHELGADFVDVPFLIENAFDDAQDTMTGALDKLGRLDRGMRRHGLGYILSTDLAAWQATLYLEPGVDEFAATSGTLHRWDFRMSWLDPLLLANGDGPARLLGINYDEGAHNQQMNCAYVQGKHGEPRFYYDKPYFLNTDGLALETAWSEYSSALQALRLTHYEGRVPLYSEHVWPDEMHLFARNGWRLMPKLLFGNFTPVMLASSLGAALQYQDRGTELWFNCDLWKSSSYPGWSPAALESALRVAYWLGAEGLYVENMDYANTPHHADATPGGALVAWSDVTHYALTNHGRVLQAFSQQYRQQNPQRLDWRDYRPRVAIIRLDDGCFGQARSTFRDRLLGNRLHPSDAVSEEWLAVWRVLTHDAIATGTLSLLCDKVYTFAEATAVPFVIPCDSVAVFDHTVSGPVLDPVECFVVCGSALSAATFDAVRTRVAAGATCLIARRLYDLHASGPLPGNWVLVDDFASPLVAQQLQPFLGPADTMRFRFKDYRLDFVRGDTPDSVRVELTALRNRVPHWTTLE